MDQFTRQFETGIQQNETLDNRFIKELLGQIWDPKLNKIDSRLATELYNALLAHLSHMDPDAQKISIEFIRAYEEDHQIAGSTQVHVLAPDLYKQCSSCYGSGQSTCSSCGGMGGRTETRIDYDYDNNPIYREEWISCFCSGGYVSCGICGGSGSTYR